MDEFYQRDHANPYLHSSSVAISYLTGDGDGGGSSDGGAMSATAYLAHRLRSISSLRMMEGVGCRVIPYWLMSLVVISSLW